MHRLLQEYLDETESAGNARQLCRALARLGAGIDLPTFAYIAIPSTTGRQLRLVTNYAEPWRKRYVEQRYEAYDPIVLHSIRQPRPFGWDRNFDGENSFVRNFFDEASGFGICYGYTIPVRHWHGRFAALTFATDRGQPAFFQTIRRHALALEVIAYQFHRQVREILEPAATSAGVYLTFRERQCLALAAQAKTFADIAVVLSISSRTVKGHIDNAKQKLGVRTVHEAVARFHSMAGHR